MNYALRDGTVGIAVVTEMVGKAIDKPNLTYMVNFDLSIDASHCPDYTRVNRTYMAAFL